MLENMYYVIFCRKISPFPGPALISLTVQLCYFMISLWTQPSLEGYLQLDNAFRSGLARRSESPCMCCVSLGLPEVVESGNPAPQRILACCFPMGKKKSRNPKDLWVTLRPWDLGGVPWVLDHLRAPILQVWELITIIVLLLLSKGQQALLSSRKPLSPPFSSLIC